MYGWRRVLAGRDRLVVVGRERVEQVVVGVRADGDDVEGGRDDRLVVLPIGGSASAGTAVATMATAAAAAIPAASVLSLCICAPSTSCRPVYPDHAG